MNLQIPQSELMHGIAENEVHLWRVFIDQVDAAKIASVLSEQERRRAAAYRYEEHRREFAVTRAMLRRILAAYTGDAAAHLRFSYGEHGKPSLNGRVEFSVSHSNNLALIAIAAFQVGVDVERIEADLEWEGVAKHFLSCVERDWITGQPPPCRVKAFLRCWTRREAYLKAIGSGLGSENDWSIASIAQTATPALKMHSFETSSAYIGAIAGAREWSAIRVCE